MDRKLRGAVVGESLREFVINTIKNSSMKSIKDIELNPRSPSKSPSISKDHILFSSLINSIRRHLAGFVGEVTHHKFDPNAFYLLDSKHAVHRKIAVAYIWIYLSELDHLVFSMASEYHTNLIIKNGIIYIKSTRLSFKIGSRIPLSDFSREAIYWYVPKSMPNSTFRCPVSLDKLKSIFEFKEFEKLPDPLDNIICLNKVVEESLKESLSLNSDTHTESILDEPINSVLGVDNENDGYKIQVNLEKSQQKFKSKSRISHTTNNQSKNNNSLSISSKPKNHKKLQNHQKTTKNQNLPSIDKKSQISINLENSLKDSSHRQIPVIKKKELSFLTTGVILQKNRSRLFDDSAIDNRAGGGINATDMSMMNTTSAVGGNIKRKSFLNQTNKHRDWSEGIDKSETFEDAWFAIYRNRAKSIHRSTDDISVHLKNNSEKQSQQNQESRHNLDARKNPIYYKIKTVVLNNAENDITRPYSFDVKKLFIIKKADYSTEERTPTLHKRARKMMMSNYIDHREEAMLKRQKLKNQTSIDENAVKQKISIKSIIKKRDNKTNPRANFGNFQDLSLTSNPKLQEPAGLGANQKQIQNSSINNMPGLLAVKDIGFQSRTAARSIIRDQKPVYSIKTIESGNSITSRKKSVLLSTTLDNNNKNKSRPISAAKQKTGNNNKEKPQQQKTNKNIKNNSNRNKGKNEKEIFSTNELLDETDFSLVVAYNGNNQKNFRTEGYAPKITDKLVKATPRRKSEARVNPTLLTSQSKHPSIANKMRIRNPSTTHKDNDFEDNNKGSKLKFGESFTIKTSKKNSTPTSVDRKGYKIKFNNENLIVSKEQALDGKDNGSPKGFFSKKKGSKKTVRVIIPDDS